MPKLPNTIPNVPSSLTLSAASKEDPALQTSVGLGKVSVRLSALPIGATVVASEQCFIALAQISTRACTSLGVILPDKSQMELVRQSGEIGLFPPGSIITNLPHSDGELIQYRISRISLRAFASRRNIQDVDSLDAPSSASDVTMTLLSRAASQFLLNKQSYSDAVAEYFTLSLYSHLFDRYGVKSSDKARFTGGLSPTHKRLIREALDQNFENSLCIANLAKRCDLSTGHFARAFRQAFGRSFHRYVLEGKIQRAKRLLLDSTVPLSKVAIEVGYADQATFTESFTRVAGVSPGRYRRRFAATVAEATPYDRTRTSRQIVTP
jgi:AraC-like DNA-binding protein